MPGFTTNGVYTVKAQYGPPNIIAKTTFQFSGSVTAGPPMPQQSLQPILQNNSINSSTNCPSIDMQENSVHNAQRTDSDSMIVEYRYGPSNPHNGCPIELRLSFEKTFDPTQNYDNVQYDIFTVDDQGKKLSSVSQDKGRTNLFAPVGNDDLKFILKGTASLTHIVIAVLGTGPEGSLDDTSLKGIVKFDVNKSSNHPENNGVQSALETQLNLARSKIAAVQTNPHPATGTLCQTMTSITFPTGNVLLDGITLQVQVAYCDEQKTRGMMFQSQLPYNRGMLFVTDQEQIMPIWMLNMQFPLDIIWFDKYGKVIHIEKNAQPCKSALETATCSVMNGGGKTSQYVLELTSGFVDRFNISEASTLKLTDSIVQAVKQSKGNTTLAKNPTMTPNSMSSSNLGLREGEWVKYQITHLDVSASDPIIEGGLKSGIMNMFAPRESDGSYISTDWIKFTVKKFSGTTAVLDTTIGLSNGTEKDMGEQIFDPKNYTAAPPAIPVDLKIGDVVPFDSRANPLKVDKITSIQIAGKNVEAFELTSTTYRYGSWGSTENDGHVFYDKNTGILLVSSASLSASGNYLSAKTDFTFSAVDFSDDLLKPNTNGIKFHPSIPSWVKNNAKWWSDGSISDGDFTKGIQYLIQDGIITVQPTPLSSNPSHAIPPWVKNSAKLWAEGQISDDEFVKGMQYLAQQGIIVTK